MGEAQARDRILTAVVEYPREQKTTGSQLSLFTGYANLGERLKFSAPQIPHLHK